MRAYFFGNFYLSSIQQGIQAQHCTAEMFGKYCYPTDEVEKMQMLYGWQKGHKTTILLNGGDCYGLSEIFNVLDSDENPYPWAYFRESQEALGSALTCVGVILPERVYETAKEIQETSPEPAGWHAIPTVFGPAITPFEFDLCVTLNGCGLAR